MTQHLAEEMPDGKWRLATWGSYLHQPSTGGETVVRMYRDSDEGPGRVARVHEVDLTIDEAEELREALADLIAWAKS